MAYSKILPPLILLIVIGCVLENNKEDIEIMKEYLTSIVNIHFNSIEFRHLPKEIINKMTYLKTHKEIAYEVIKEELLNTSSNVDNTNRVVEDWSYYRINDLKLIIEGPSVLDCCLTKLLQKNVILGENKGIYIYPNHLTLYMLYFGDTILPYLEKYFTYRIDIHFPYTCGQNETILRTCLCAYTLSEIGGDKSRDLMFRFVSNNRDIANEEVQDILRWICYCISKTIFLANDKRPLSQYSESELAQIGHGGNIIYKNIVNPKEDDYYGDNQIDLWKKIKGYIPDKIIIE